MLPVDREVDVVGNNVGATSDRQAAAAPDRSIINPNYPSSQAERTYFATIDAQTSDVPAGGSGPTTANVTSPTVNTPAYPPSGSGGGGSSVANYDPNNYPPVTSASSGLTATPTNYMPYIAAGAIALFALIALKLVRR